ADAPEVRQEQLVHCIVTAFQRRGQAEPLVVLAEHRASERPAAEAVTLVRDEQATDLARRYRLVRGSRVAGRDEHVAGCRSVLAAVTQPPDPSLGHFGREPTVPLL